MVRLLLIYDKANYLLRCRKNFKIVIILSRNDQGMLKMLRLQLDN